MSAITVRYSKLILTDLVANTIQLSESGVLGHRVQVPVSVDDLNTLFVWDRPVGSSRPVGHFNAAGLQGKPFSSILMKAFSTYYSDIDGVKEGLHFSSSILDSNTDPRIRNDGTISSNDIVMAYVLYKCYGSSASPTKDSIYNLEDAHNMLTNEIFIESIESSLREEEALSSSPGSASKGAVDTMFRDLVASDPQRFFDAHGTQIPGLFESNADQASSGSWNFVQNDKVEFRVQFTFKEPVTRRPVQDSDIESTIVIPAGSTFYIRLQLLATDTEQGMKAKTSIKELEEQKEAADVAASKTKAAANAASTSRAVEESRQAAAAQTAAATERYTKALQLHASQAIAAMEAQAAAQAAQDVYKQALASGKTESEVQFQRAAAEKAQAFAANAKAIAEATESEIQAAKNAMDTAIQALAAAQTATAAASLDLAKSNADAAKSAYEKAQADALVAAEAKAAADAASDPFTQTLTKAQEFLLDPQTIVHAQTTFNSKTIERTNAESLESQAAATLANYTSLYTFATDALSYAIFQGKPLDEIQILRASAVSLEAEVERAQEAHTHATQALITAYNAEFAALQAANTLEKNANQLRVDLSTMKENELIRVVTAATESYSKATTAYNAAVQLATTAQGALTLAIRNGATTEEVQVKRSVVLQANATVTSTKQQMDQANITVLQASSAKDAATAIKETMIDQYSNIVAANTTKEGVFQSTLSTERSIQATFAASAAMNESVKHLVDLHIEVVNAQLSYKTAEAAYQTTRREINVALAQGKTEPEILELQLALEEKTKQLNFAKAAWKSASALYTVAKTSASESPNGSHILETVAKQLIQQITDAKINTIVLEFNKTLQDQAAAITKEKIARDLYQLAQKNLAAAITHKAGLSEITALRDAVSRAAVVHAQAISNINLANAATLEAKKNVILSNYPAPVLSTNAWYDAALTSSLTLTGDYVDEWDSKVGSIPITSSKNNPVYTIYNGRNGVELINMGPSGIMFMSNYASADINLSTSTTLFMVVTIVNLSNSPSNLFYFFSPSTQTVYNLVTTTDGSSTILGTSAPETGSFGTSFYIDGRPSTPSSRISVPNGQTFQFSVRANSIGLQSDATQLRLYPASEHYDVIYHEIRIVNDDIPEQKRHQMEGYLAWKWGINDALPITHPYYPPPSSDLPADPNVTALLDAAQLLQTDQAATAYQNSLVEQLLQHYKLFAEWSVEYNTANLQYIAAIKALNQANAAGSPLTQMLPLQQTLQKAVERLSTAIQKLHGATTQLLTDNADASGNPSTLAIYDTFIGDVTSSSYKALQTTLMNVLLLAKETQTAALSAKQSAQARYDSLAKELQTAILQGKPVTPLQEQLQAASNKVAKTTEQYTLSVSAQTNANTVFTDLSPSSNLLSILSSVSAILQLSQTVQATAIQAAKSNELTMNLIRAQAEFNSAVNAHDVATGHVTTATEALNTAVTAGASIDQITQLRATLASAEAEKANTKIVVDRTSSAYAFAQTNVIADPAASAMLQASAAAQSAAVAGATANALVDLYNKAKGDALEATSAYSFAYSAFLSAEQALSTAVDQGATLSTIQTLQQSVLTKGHDASLKRAVMNAANEAANDLLEQINLNPKVEAIQSAAVSQQESSAAIQTYLALGFIAVQAKQYLDSVKESYNKAKEAHTIAKLALDSAIDAGKGVSELQALQATIVSATGAITLATEKVDLAQAAYETAYDAADLDTEAFDILQTFAETMDTAKQGVADNLAAILLKQANDELTLATNTRNQANAALDTKQSALQTAVDASGMIPQEILQYQAAVAVATEVANKAQVAFGKATTKVLALSGFKYNKSIGRYVLDKKFVPKVVTEGVAFYIGTIKVIPVDSGEFSPAVAYTLGSLIYYPTMDSSQYINISAGKIT